MAGVVRCATLTDMATTLDPTPMLRRRPGSGPLAGVAAGIAVHTGLRPLAVRIGFLLGGLAGVVLYGVFWVVLPADHESEPSPDQRKGLLLALVLFAGGLAVVALQLGLLSFGPFAVPAGLVAVGAAL